MPVDINISEIKRQIALFEDRITLLRKNLRYYRDTQRSDRIYQKAFLATFTKVQEQATPLLVENALRACEQSGEYADPFFIEPLLEAIKHPETIKLRHTKGLGIEIIVNLDRTAGTLEEYADAVRVAREVLKSRRKSFVKDPPPDLASRMWYEKIYSVDRLGLGYVPRRVWDRKKKEYKEVNIKDKIIGKYWETMYLRAQNFIHPAPWWRLLENGNPAGSLSSDIGGYPAPRVSASRFVARTVATLRQIAYSIMKEEHARIFAELEGVINRSYEEIDRLELELTRLRALILVDYTLPETRRIRAEELVRQRLGEQMLYARPERLQYLFDQLVYGTQISMHGISLGTYEGKRIRIRVLEILRQLDAEFGRGE